MWITVFILAVANFYYNNSIIQNYQNYNNPKPPARNPPKCTYGDTPSVQKSTLTECGDGYKYTHTDGNSYKIATNQTSFATMCSSFCDQVPLNGKCKTPSQTEEYTKCENEFRPPTNCNSSVKPIVYVYVVDGGDKTLYYPVTKLLSASCSGS